MAHDADFSLVDLDPLRERPEMIAPVAPFGVAHPLAQFGHLVLLIQIGNIPNDEDRLDDVQFEKQHLLRAIALQKK